MTVTIRTAVPSDAGALAGLLNQLGYPSSEHDVRTRLAYWASAPHSEVLVAEAGEAVSGCLSLHAVPVMLPLNGTHSTIDQAGTVPLGAVPSRGAARFIDSIRRDDYRQKLRSLA